MFLQRNTSHLRLNELFSSHRQPKENNTLKYEIWDALGGPRAAGLPVETADYTDGKIVRKSMQNGAVQCTGGMLVYV